MWHRLHFLKPCWQTKFLFNWQGRRSRAVMVILSHHHPPPPITWTLLCCFSASLHPPLSPSNPPPQLSRFKGLQSNSPMNYTISSYKHFWCLSVQIIPFFLWYVWNHELGYNSLYSMAKSFWFFLQFSKNNKILKTYKSSFWSLWRLEGRSPGTD